MLWVYELKGARLPADLPGEGLVGVWPEAPWYYVFYTREARESILEWLGKNPGWRLASLYETPYEAWQDISLAPQTVGRFLVTLQPASPGLLPGTRTGSGAHQAVPTETHGRKVIPLRLDPGVVFGSGLHPTTRGCLSAISEIFEGNAVRTALDFGTGSGILAVACALAGAEEVIAVDLNPLALEVASRNALSNGVSDRIGFVAADRMEVLTTQPDLLLMNLEWPILEDKLQKGSWRNADWVVLSGFLQGRLQEAARLASPGFRAVKTTILDGWPTVTLRRIP